MKQEKRKKININQKSGGKGKKERKGYRNLHLHGYSLIFVMHLRKKNLSITNIINKQILENIDSSPS